MKKPEDYFNFLNWAFGLHKEDASMEEDTSKK
jgi:hypothetical protein